MAQIGARLDPESGDLTPVVGAQTDVAPLGRDMPKPRHELTADEDIDPVDWASVEAMDEFRQLMAAKMRFIIPATIFFLVYYLALPLLAGYAKGFMDTKVIGVVNVAYLFALSQFIMTWVVAFWYLSKAEVFDRMTSNIVSKVRGMKGGGK